MSDGEVRCENCKCDFDPRIEMSVRVDYTMTGTINNISIAKTLFYCGRSCLLVDAELLASTTNDEVQRYQMGKAMKQWERDVELSLGLEDELQNIKDAK